MHYHVYSHCIYKQKNLDWLLLRLPALYTQDAKKKTNKLGK